MIAFGQKQWENECMKAHDAKRHPGPFRTMRVDAASAGILVAVAFLILGLVGRPIAKRFFLGTFVFGGMVAWLLRRSRKE